MSEPWDAPNQQVVRADESPPWQEGTGGDPGAVAAAPVEQKEPDELDGLSKPELLAYGQQLGISPMNAGMSKEEIRDAIDQQQSES
jgi:hypothetical protein